MGIKKLFTVPDGEKVTEKALRRVLISSVCSILLCMTCLVSTTWAWFTVSIENTGNVIEIGSFSVAITVDNNTLEDSTVYTLTPGTPYTVTIANTGTSKGYCKIKLSGEGMDAVTYSTGTLKPAVPDASQNAGSITFKITVYSETKMEFTKFWGDASSGVNVVPNQITVGDEPDTPGADTPGDETPGADTPGADTPGADTTEPEMTEPETTEPETTEHETTEPSTEATTAPTTEPSTDTTTAPTEEASPEETTTTQPETNPTESGATEGTDPSTETTTASTESTAESTGE